MALFKQTGSPEVYHSVLLKYCRKNLHFHYSSMAARTHLAVLDHNENVHCQQATTTSGVSQYNVYFPKQTKDWLARKIYEPTTQNLRDVLLQKVLERRTDPTVVFKDLASQVALLDLPSNIATKDKPDKEAAIAKHQGLAESMEENQEKEDLSEAEKNHVKTGEKYFSCSQSKQRLKKKSQEIFHLHSVWKEIDKQKWS